MTTELKRIQLLQKTTPDFVSTDPVLLAGEAAIADASSANPIVKIGDGVRPWSVLPALLSLAPLYVAGPVTMLPPGADAVVVIDNTVTPPTITFSIPRGAQGSPGPTGPTGATGATGAVGPAPNLSVGSTVTGTPGTPADVVITGTSPNYVLTFTIPEGLQGTPGAPGATGATGATGAVGPAPNLSVGSTVTGAAGTPADVVITGTSPNYVLTFTIPQGIKGDKGDTGSPGLPGGSFANPTALVGLTAVNGSAGSGIRSDGAPALDVGIAPSWTAGHTFTLAGTLAGASTVALSSTRPLLTFRETDAAVDNGRWYIDAQGEQMRFACFNDAGTVSSVYMLVDRTGTTIDSVTFQEKTVFTSANPQILINAATPVLAMYQSGAAVDNRRWDIVAASEMLLFRATNDAASTANSFMYVERTGAVIDYVIFPPMARFTKPQTAGATTSPVLLISDAPAIGFWESSLAGADNSRWDILVNSSEMLFRCESDSAVATDFLKCSRTAGMPNVLTLAAQDIRLSQLLQTGAVSGSAGYREALRFTWTGGSTSTNTTWSGRAASFHGSATTLTVATTGVPDSQIFTVLHAGTGNMTITPSSGTLYWFNGQGSLTTGNRTATPGSVFVVLVNPSTTDAYIWGMGLS